MNTKSFVELTKNDNKIAGGKGASLGEMVHARVPVPSGFVVLSGAFERYISETKIGADINAALGKVKHQDIASVERASKKIMAIILGEDIPKDITIEIKAAFNKLDTKFVAVRSSATSEDSASGAWAGQLDTYLNTSEKELLKNVKRCWASLYTPRAIFYRYEKGLNNKSISVAVVIQKMVQSEISGVAFSVHPVTKDRNQMLIEAGYGLGEAIVSGSITPDNYIVLKKENKILDKSISLQVKKLNKAQQGNKWAIVPKKEQGSQKLSDLEILKLSKLVKKIELHYGFPCDIEWAKKGNEFYITQSRPITTLTSLKSIKVNKDDSSRAFISYENPIYPYFYSATSAAPSKKYKGKYLMGGWFVKFRYGTTAIVDAPTSSFKEYGDFFLNLINTKDKEFCNHLFQLGKDLVNLTNELEKINYLDLKTGKNSSLKAFYKKSEDLYAEAIGFGYSLDFALNAYINDEGLNIHELENKYPSFSAIESSELSKIFKIRNKVQSNKAFLNHAHKYSWLKNDYSGEYQMAAQDFLNRKTSLIAKKYVALKLKLTKPNSISEWISFMTMMRDQRKKCNLIMDGLLDRYLQNECAKYGLQRKDAVMLTVKEFEKNKKKGIRKYKGIRTAEVTHHGLEDVTEQVWKKAVKDTLVITESKEIKGVSAMPGLVTGKARIVLSRADFGKIEKGDVLVTSMTRPEFTQVLSQISAIITNEGGVTSHAAIISRELGIPCVIGTHTATKILKDGDLVEVNANTGIIKIL
jgi:phosphohistidine swiveling domain-containing protein